MADRKFYKFGPGTHTFPKELFLSVDDGTTQPKTALFRGRSAGGGGNGGAGETTHNTRWIGLGGSAGAEFEKVISVERDVVLVVGAKGLKGLGGIGSISGEADGSGGTPATAGGLSSIEFGSLYTGGTCTISASGGDTTPGLGGTVTHSGSDLVETGVLPLGGDNTVTSIPDFTCDGGDSGVEGGLITPDTDVTAVTGYGSGGGGVGGRGHGDRAGVAAVDNFWGFGTNFPGGLSFMGEDLGKGGRGGKAGHDGTAGQGPGGGGGGGGTRPRTGGLTGLPDDVIQAFKDRGLDPGPDQDWLGITLITNGDDGADGVIEVITPAPEDGSDCCCEEDTTIVCSKDTFYFPSSITIIFSAKPWVTADGKPNDIPSETISLGTFEITDVCSNPETGDPGSGHSQEVFGPSVGTNFTSGLADLLDGLEVTLNAVGVDSGDSCCDVIYKVTSVVTRCGATWTAQVMGETPVPVGFASKQLSFSTDCSISLCNTSSSPIEALIGDLFEAGNNYVEISVCTDNTYTLDAKFDVGGAQLEETTCEDPGEACDDFHNATFEITDSGTLDDLTWESLISKVFSQTPGSTTVLPTFNNYFVGGFGDSIHVTTVACDGGEGTIDCEYASAVLADYSHQGTVLGSGKISFEIE